MTTTHHMWAWPIRFASTSYVVRATIGGLSENLTFPASGSLDPETDYWMVDDATATSLIEMLEDTLNTHSLAAGLGGVVVSLTNWLVTATVGGGGSSILWTHGSTTLDGEIWGFNANATTGQLLPQGLWRPRLGAYQDSRIRQPYLGGLTRALSGAIRVVQSSVAKRTRDISYRYLNKTRALDEYADATEPTNTFEQLQSNAIMLGRKLRFIANEEDSSTYVDYRTRSLIDTLRVMDAPNLVWWECSLEVVEA